MTSRESFSRFFPLHDHLLCVVPALGRVTLIFNVDDALLGGPKLKLVELTRITVRIKTGRPVANHELNAGLRTGPPIEPGEWVVDGLHTRRRSEPLKVQLLKFQDKLSSGSEP